MIMSTSLKQSATPAPEPYYILITHDGTPRGGFRNYRIVDEQNRTPDLMKYYTGPFKSRDCAVTWSLADLKNRFPEAHKRLLSQPSRDPVLTELGGSLFLKSPGLYQGLISPLQVTAHLTIEEFDEASEHTVLMDPYGLASNR